MKIKINQMSCKKCGHKWVARIVDLKVCPKCKSPWWDKERTHVRK